MKKKQAHQAQAIKKILSTPGKKKPFVGEGRSGMASVGTEKLTTKK